ncbi:hypothetical protein QBC47DRAFT_368684 [Echria macrotheca]|uniref:rRNA biogenesis protein RRP36 n=1 Tax=Echria macrotheca TaxID=438768 RepID=A0AAJ0BN51_9PEZI|nr:hypothetical protein QBC47DRAFT_368684 [Echria macrotheca]
MSSAKRKLPNLGLQRRVRPRVEPEPESDAEASGTSDEAPSEEDVDDSGSGSDSDGDEDASDVSDGSEPDSEAESGVDPSQLSFGALARAQASLPPRKKKGPAKAGDEQDADSDSDDDDQQTKKPRSSEKKVLKRPSKHAPVEMTSKKQVSRRRDFIEVPKLQARDPRFLPLNTSGKGVEEARARKAYSFLDDYRRDELKQLRAAAKKEKDATARERLQRAAMSLESRLEAQARKDREREVLEEHRRQEKELVRQGKKPFYLKRSEQKKQLLLDRFQGMKKGQVDKAIERRRKKTASKEKKSLPFARRTAEDR